MKKCYIGVSGNIGSFSEEAANFYCQKNNIIDYELDYLINVENVLRSLEDRSIDLAIFPLENQRSGRFRESIDAMSKYPFKIESYFDINAQMHLLAKHGINIFNITKVVSHPQSLRECKDYLERKWKNAELEEYIDTAEAAKALRTGRFNENTAVIAPKVCAKIYRLNIIEHHIQDSKFNFTTFIAAKK